MKKRVLITIIALMITMFAASLKSIADFGNFSGDTDFDYSGDYGGSSFSSDNSDDNDYYEKSSGAGDWNTLTVLIIGTIIVFAWAASASRMKEKTNSRGTVTGERAASRKLTPIEEYVKLDPNFNEAALCEKASNLYVKMQNGWTAKDIEPLRPYFTDALFTQTERSLKGIIKRGETNFVERIAVLDVTPQGFYQASGEDHIILRLRTRIIDYTLKDSTNQLISGSRDKEKFMTYEWDVMRTTGVLTGSGTDGVKKITCPGCGAPLDINVSARCPYCGSVVQKQAHDWVINAIRGIKQKTAN